jgi:hypothetical protein
MSSCRSFNLGHNGRTIFDHQILVDGQKDLMYNQNNRTSMSKEHISIIAQADMSLIREDSFLGQDYIVVPVVAMIEGVRLGMGQEGAELGLAEEFGKFPAGWNNRPVVMNHPSVDGTLVSANDPEILTQFAFGFTAKTSLDGIKLKTEAWINPQRAKELGGEAEDVLTRIQSVDEGAEDPIEVSVGFFCDVEKKSGKFKGQAYTGIWKNIVPDHLAFLSEGTKGACSVEIGCGTPRVNQKGGESLVAQKLTTSSPTSPPTLQAKQCSCGGGSDDVILVQNQLNDGLHAQEFLVRAFEDALLDGDVRKLLRDALEKKVGCYCYLVGFTSSNVVYERSQDMGSYKTYQLSYSISGTTVTLGENPVEVTVVMKVVTKGDPMTTQTTQTASTTGQEMSDEDKAKMKAKEDAKKAKGQEEPVAPTVTPIAPTPTAQTTPAPIAPAAPAAPLTLQQYLDAAPAELKEVLTSGLKMHEDRKNGLIKALKENPRNKFTEDTLKGMSVDMLQNLVDLATLPDYSGRRGPEAPTTQAADESTVAAPKVFEFKKTA